MNERGQPRHEIKRKSRFDAAFETLGSRAYLALPPLAEGVALACFGRTAGQALMLGLIGTAAGDGTRATIQMVRNHAVRRKEKALPPGILGGYDTRLLPQILSDAARERTIQEPTKPVEPHVIYSVND